MQTQYYNDRHAMQRNQYISIKISSGYFMELDKLLLKVNKEQKAKKQEKGKSEEEYGGEGQIQLRSKTQKVIEMTVYMNAETKKPREQIRDSETESLIWKRDI